MPPGKAIITRSQNVNCNFFSLFFFLKEPSIIITFFPKTNYRIKKKLFPPIFFLTKWHLKRRDKVSKIRLNRSQNQPSISPKFQMIDLGKACYREVLLVFRISFQDILLTPDCNVKCEISSLFNLQCSAIANTRHKDNQICVVVVNNRSGNKNFNLTASESQRYETKTFETACVVLCHILIPFISWINSLVLGHEFISYKSRYITEIVSIMKMQSSNNIPMCMTRTHP